MYSGENVFGLFCLMRGKVKKNFWRKKKKEVQKTFSSIILERDQNFYNLE